MGVLESIPPGAWLGVFFAVLVFAARMGLADADDVRDLKDRVAELEEELEEIRDQLERPAPDYLD